MDERTRKNYIRRQFAEKIQHYGLESFLTIGRNRSLIEGEKDADIVKRESIQVVEYGLSSWDDVRKVFEKWESQGIARILKDPELAAPEEPVLQMLKMFDGTEIWWKKNDPRLKDSGEI